MATFNSCCVVAGVGCVDGVVRGVAVGRGIFLILSHIGFRIMVRSLPPPSQE